MSRAAAVWMSAIAVSVALSGSALTGAHTLPADLLDPRLIAANLCGGAPSSPDRYFKSFGFSVVSPALAADTPPRLWPGLGNHTFPISTSNTEAQGFFDQGLMLVYAFNSWEGSHSFKAAQALDPACAMCFWGEALALSTDFNSAMPPDADRLALEALAKARTLSAKARPEEQALINALITRYSADPKPNRFTLAQAYAAAMADVYKRFPLNDDIAVLYAEAVFRIANNYWMPDRRTPQGQIVGALSAIEAVLKRNPDHPGAIHYYIHIMETSNAPERAEPYANRLGELVPGAAHLVHMPAHIYFGMGRYLDALRVNEIALAVDDEYLKTARTSDRYRYGYYGHNLHFAMASAQMAGDAEWALYYAERLTNFFPEGFVATLPSAFRIQTAAYYARLQYDSAAAVLRLADPGDSQPLIKAAWHYVRAVASADLLDLNGAAREIDQLAALHALSQRDDAPPLLRFTGRPVMAISELVARGRLLQATGNLLAAIEKFQEAAALQDKMNYLEPPLWYYPVRQTLGALYFQTGKTKEAAQAFMQALIVRPNNAAALYGLKTVQEAMGDPAAAATAELLERAAVPGAKFSMDRL